MHIKSNRENKDTKTPNFKQLNREQFKSRVIELLPFATSQDLDVPDDLIETMVDAGIEFGFGPYDTACEIIDHVMYPDLPL